MTTMVPIRKARQSTPQTVPLPGPHVAQPLAREAIFTERPEAARGARFPWFTIFSFLVLVCAPMAAGIWYLEERAADRYTSRAAFSIRSNEDTAPMEIFGALTRISGSAGTTDAQILYDFIQSQQIVQQVDGRVGLTGIFAKQPQDILFTLEPGVPIEDLVEHWQWMVDVAIDPATGLLSIEARAFSPDDAQAIARAILSESAELVNRLSDSARTDLVQATQRELEEAEHRLRKIRVKLRLFRDHEQKVDPTLNVKAKLELIAGLQEDRAKAIIKLDQLSGVLDPQAPQIRSLKRRIETIDRRIADERTRLGTGTAADGGDSRPLSRVVGDYEELLVDREFAEQAYTVALAGHQQALVEARRRHRHLAVHISPTLSEKAEHPDKPVLILTAFVLVFAAWSIVTLVIGNIAERR